MAASLTTLAVMQRERNTQAANRLPAIPAAPQASPSYTVADLGTLGGVTTKGMGINEDGQIVGASQSGSYLYGFLWDGNTMTNLGDLGGQWSWAYDINNTGQVVGGSPLGSADNHAFRRQQSGGMVKINSGAGDTIHAIIGGKPSASPSNPPISRLQLFNSGTSLNGKVHLSISDEGAVDLLVANGGQLTSTEARLGGLLPTAPSTGVVCGDGSPWQTGNIDASQARLGGLPSRPCWAYLCAYKAFRDTLVVLSHLSCWLHLRLEWPSSSNKHIG